tara:strand:+ start:255 stop:404 length:150 start_codon:yes stop_codon:yes gene_type:complete
MTFDELLEYVAEHYDEVTILEALEITSEELVERFSDKILEKIYKFKEME